MYGGKSTFSHTQAFRQKLMRERKKTPPSKDKFVLITICISILAMLILVFYPFPQTKKNVENVVLESAEVLAVDEVERTKETSFTKDNAQFMVTIRLHSGEETVLMHQTLNQPGYDIYPKVGDKILVTKIKNSYAIVDYERMPGMLFLALIFSLSLMILGKWSGVKSLFVLLFAIILIVKGLVLLILLYPQSIIFWTVLIGSLITFVTQVVLNGVNEKSLGAVLGTIVGILIAGMIAHFAIHGIYLNGMEEESSVMLKIRYLKDVDFRDILFAGIVLGALGAIMDVAVSISSAQYELKKIAPLTSFHDLVESGFNIGRDIMGTMANTLVLAYMGSTLPLLLLIGVQPELSLERVLNLNMIVTEIARSLIGSIGLVLSIPATAIITAFFLSHTGKRTRFHIKKSF